MISMKFKKVPISRAKKKRKTTTPALELLWKENTQRASENKLLPLTYEETKYTIECSREENGVPCED